MTQRTLTSVLGNSQRLDGGAMFGNVPKAMWSQWLAPDERNCIPLVCRALLVQEAGRNILFETGIGAFLEPKLRERFGVSEEKHVLLDSLKAAGLGHEQIDVVVLSHLHFDHAGGLLSAWQKDEEPRLLFPNATYVVGAEAMARAQQPHPRDRASFIAQLPELLIASGRLDLIKGESSVTLGKGYRFWRSEGHTPGLMLTEITMPDGPVFFAADLIPGVPWVHLPITMGYDRYPEKLIDEKQEVLTYLAENNGRIFFTHDHRIAMSRVTQDDRGRFASAEEQVTLKELAV